MSAIAPVIEQYGPFLYLAIGIVIAVVTGYWIAQKGE